MKNLFKRLPTFSADYSGVCNAIQHMRCLIILHGQGGCIGGVSTCDDFEKEKNENQQLQMKIVKLEAEMKNHKK